MFSKGNESPAPGSEGALGGSSQQTARSSGMPSIISADLKVVGDLHCAGDIQIEGIVEGDIKSQTVTVGEGAEVSGSVYGQTVRVSGNVKGQIEASAVTLAKTARVAGDVVHETLSIEAGAQLEGMCRRLQASQASAKSAAQQKITDLKSAQRDSGGSASSSSSSGSSSAASSAGAMSSSGGSAGKPAAG